MNKIKFFATALVLAVVSAFSLYAIFPARYRNSEVGVLEPFLNSCIITPVDGQGMGTGVLLDTGYILTAGHVVDRDGDGAIDEDERVVNLVFGLETAKGAVIYLSKKQDFAVVMPIEKVDRLGISVTKEYLKVGDTVYAIGATGGHPISIAKGMIVANGYRGMSRASCAISGGNSGGGIFDSRGELLGIVVAVGTKGETYSLPITIPSEREDGTMSFYLTFTHIRMQRELPNNCLFVETTDIQRELKDANLLYLVEPIPFSVDPLLVKTLIHLILFGVALLYVRKHLS